MPGVEDIIGEYRCGETFSLTDTLCPVWPAVVCAETTLHFPFKHPQLPAPQSIGPSQLIVHITLSQDGAAALPVQLVGWQHWAGTQSSSEVQLRESAGAVVTSGVSAGCAGVVVPAGAEPPVHPAVRITAIETMRRAMIFASMYKGIGSGKYKRGEDCREYKRN
jgi:hypothetical protein